MLAIVLLILALVCFLVAACSVPTGRIHCGWLGAALFTLATLVGAWPGHA